ncbi:MAG TPA: hypothetical protein VIF37_17000 [Methylobacter sp.]
MDAVGASQLLSTHYADRYTQGRRHPGRDCRDPEAMDGNTEANYQFYDKDLVS